MIHIVLHGRETQSDYKYSLVMFCFVWRLCDKNETGMKIYADLDVLLLLYSCMHLVQSISVFVDNIGTSAGPG